MKPRSTQLALVLGGACCTCGGLALCVLAATSPRDLIEVLGSLIGVWAAGAGALLLERARAGRTVPRRSRPISLRPVAPYAAHPAGHADPCVPERACQRRDATRSGRRATTISSERRSRA